MLTDHARRRGRRQANWPRSRSSPLLHRHSSRSLCHPASVACRAQGFAIAAPERVEPADQELDVVSLDRVTSHVSPGRQLRTRREHARGRVWAGSGAGIWQRVSVSQARAESYACAGGAATVKRYSISATIRHQPSGSASPSRVQDRGCRRGSRPTATPFASSWSRSAARSSA